MKDIFMSTFFFSSPSLILAVREPRIIERWLFEVHRGQDSENKENELEES